MAQATRRVLGAWPLRSRLWEKPKMHKLVALLSGLPAEIQREDSTCWLETPSHRSMPVVPAGARALLGRFVTGCHGIQGITHGRC